MFKNRLNAKASLGEAAPRTAAVIGGSGFLGSHMSQRLVQEGARVYCLDNFETGRPDNVDHLAGRDNFRLVEHDILAPIPASLPRFDEIYNFACPASPPHYQADRVRTALICFQGALNCLQRAHADGARLFHASTSEIYGDPDVHPQTEEYWGNVNTIGPRSCYDEGKRFAETLITDFGKQNGVVVRLARIFNTYGPRMQPDDGRVVSNFVVQALQNQAITIYGSGEQTRSFCYVDDLIEGIGRLMRSGDHVTGPVNLGNPTETTVGELAAMVLSFTQSKSKLIQLPLPTDDPRRRRPDITKAQAWLGWTPKVSLEDGLGKTIEYFRSTAASPAEVKARAPSRRFVEARRDYEIGLQHLPCAG